MGKQFNDRDLVKAFFGSVMLVLGFLDAAVVSICTIDPKVSYFSHLRQHLWLYKLTWCQHWLRHGLHDHGRRWH